MVCDTEIMGPSSFQTLHAVEKRKLSVKDDAGE